MRPRRTPIENALIESFNGRIRDECLNVQEFTSLEDAALRIDGGRTTIAIDHTARSAI